MNERQMRQYVGTKSVKATPMTMGEAYEHKLLKDGVCPSEDETDKAGYLVEYEGGYQSWCPSEPFEKAYRVSETFLDRLTIEFNEVKTRLKSLKNFLMKYSFDGLEKEVGAKQAALLLMQKTFMEQYVEILEIRIDDLKNKNHKTDIDQ